MTAKRRAITAQLESQRADSAQPRMDALRSDLLLFVGQIGSEDFEVEPSIFLAAFAQHLDPLKTAKNLFSLSIIF